MDIVELHCGSFFLVKIIIKIDQRMHTSQLLFIVIQIVLHHTFGPYTDFGTHYIIQPKKRMTKIKKSNYHHHMLLPAPETIVPVFLRSIMRTLQPKHNIHCSKNLPICKIGMQCNANANAVRRH